MNNVITDVKRVAKLLTKGDKIIVRGDGDETQAWGIDIEEDKDGNKKLIILIN